MISVQLEKIINDFLLLAGGRKVFITTFSSAAGAEKGSNKLFTQSTLL